MNDIIKIVSAQKNISTQWFEIKLKYQNWCTISNSSTQSSETKYKKKQKNSVKVLVNILSCKFIYE